MTAQTRPLVEKVAKAIIEGGYNPATAIALANIAIGTCHIEELIALLRDTVAAYGKPGGPWNVPSEPGSWIARARDLLAKIDGEAA